MHCKVTLWRLVQNGLPVPARMPCAGSESCGCGVVVTPSGSLLDHSHHLWVCPVARAVVASVEAQLPAAQRPLSQRALWLGVVPEGVHRGIWALVCLAVIEAMERNRALARRRERERRERQAQQASQQAGPLGRVQLTLERGDDGQLGHAAPPAEPQDVPPLAPGRAMAQALGARAVEWLWGLLREACALGVVSDAWQEGADAEQPFLAWRAEPPGWFVVRV